MKSTAVKVVIGVLSVLLLGALCVGVIYNPFTSSAPTTLQADLRNQIVAVPDTINPGQLIGWYFDPKDDLDVKVLDSRKEDYKRVYYVQVTTKSSKDGQTLNGILEAYYVTIAKTQYLIALNSINLQTSAVLPAPNAQPPPAKTPAPPGLQPAQRLPGQ